MQPCRERAKAKYPFITAPVGRGKPVVAYRVGQMTGANRKWRTLYHQPLTRYLQWETQADHIERSQPVSLAKKSLCLCTVLCEIYSVSWRFECENEPTNPEQRRLLLRIACLSQQSKTQTFLNIKVLFLIVSAYICNSSIGPDISDGSFDDAHPEA